MNWIIFAVVMCRSNVRLTITFLMKKKREKKIQKYDPKKSSCIVRARV